MICPEVPSSLLPGLSTPSSSRERSLLLIAASFLIAGTATLGLLQTPIIPLLLLLAVWSISCAAAHIGLSMLLPRRDPFLLPIAALLSGWGLLLIARLAPNFLLRQTIWLLVSTAALLLLVHASRNLRWLRRFRYTWLFGGLALLAATLILGVNPSGYGPRLWLGAGGVYFQPSELMKLLMIAYLASYLAERQKLLIAEGHTIGRWRLPPLAYVGPLLVLFGLTVVILAWQQDLGAALLFFFTFLGMLYLATHQWGYAAAGMMLFLIAGIVGYAVSPKVALRVETWINPWPEAANRAFQIVQSLLAVGAGGIVGQGFGLGVPTYIPAVHTDFVFAAIGEEFGLAGMLALIALYAILMLRGFRAALAACQPFERLLTTGITIGLAVQAWVIIAGNIKLIPITGVTLPFVSYGGSSLVTSFIALALLLRVSGNWGTGRPSCAHQATDAPTRRLACILTAAIALLAVVCGYWAIIRADALRARADNPRRVLYEQRLLRGRILDRNGQVLADIQVDADGVVTRHYFLPEAAPALGYASMRYGVGGAEAAFDETLRGEAGRSAWQAAWNSLLHRSPHGRDVQVTLDAKLQAQAQRALGEQAGALVLLDASTGEILALASYPTFDPARLDETWESLRADPSAPLLNRATHGLYQPGSTFHTILLTEALERETTTLTTMVHNPSAALYIDHIRLTCREPLPSPTTLGDAYRAGCPAPFAMLGRQLGAESLERAIARWALTIPPTLEIGAESPDWNADTLTTTAALGNEAVGQGLLTVTPLQMALVAATLANEGTMPAPRLGLRTQNGQGLWSAAESRGAPHFVLSPRLAQELLDAWEHNGPVAGLLGTAIGGENQARHAWFLGIAPTESPRYAIAVLLENPDDPIEAATIGQALLQGAASRLQEH